MAKRKAHRPSRWHPRPRQKIKYIKASKYILSSELLLIPGLRLSPDWEPIRLDQQLLRSLVDFVARGKVEWQNGSTYSRMAAGAAPKPAQATPPKAYDRPHVTRDEPGNASGGGEANEAKKIRQVLPAPAWHRGFLLFFSEWYLFSPWGSVRPDAPPACDSVSPQGTNPHDPSIPKNLCPGFPPWPE